jgi:hypothetical protein
MKNEKDSRFIYNKDDLIDVTYDTKDRPKSSLFIVEDAHSRGPVGRGK